MKCPLLATKSYYEQILKQYNTGENKQQRRTRRSFWFRCQWPTHFRSRERRTCYACIYRDITEADITSRQPEQVASSLNEGATDATLQSSVTYTNNQIDSIDSIDSIQMTRKKQI